MVKRRWWAGRSWRARAGWVLLGGALAVLGVALPVWALAGDVNAVAGWANVLAVPVSAAGFVVALLVPGLDGVAVPPAPPPPGTSPPFVRALEEQQARDRRLAGAVVEGAAAVGAS